MPVNVKAKIVDTFAKLSAQKDVDKITVKDIVEACQISRQTFYYHFQDILDVIEWSTEQAFSQLLDRTLTAEDPEVVMHDFILASEDAAPLLRKLLHSQRREQVEQLLVRSVRTYLQEMNRALNRAPQIPFEEMEVALDFCTYGIVGLLLDCCERTNVDRQKLAYQMRRLLVERLSETETDK